MSLVEYRIEQVPINREEPRLLQLVERLAELGRQGWHVASVDLTPHAAFEESPLTVLLERDGSASSSRTPDGHQGSSVRQRGVPGPGAARLDGEQGR
jgi:hypothetical protein